MKIFLQILFTIFSINLIAQNSIFEHYSVQDGLPSSEIYSQLQDQNGYMWFATSRGVCRFDGFEFKTFTMKDGLPSNSIVKMYKDYKGRIWFSSYEGFLSYYENNKIIQYPLNELIVKIAKNYYIDNLCVDSNDNLWIMPNLGGIYLIDTLNNISEYKPKYETNYKIFFEIKPNGFLWNNNIEADNEDSLSFKILNNIYYLDFKSSKIISLRRYFYKISDTEFLLSYGNKLFYLNNKIISTIDFTNEISGIFSDDKGNFWISVMYEGVYVYANKDLNNFPERYLKGKSPISVFQDSEGNYWLSTTEDGIYFVSSFQFYTYYQFGFSDYNILSMEKLDNDLYFSTYDKQVFKCNVESNKILSIQNLNLNKNINYTVLDILADNNKNVWFLSYQLIKLKDKKTTIIDSLNRAYNMSLNSKNQIIISSQNGYVKFDENRLIQDYCNDNINLSNYVFEDKLGIMWIGTLNGLYKVDNNKMEYYGDFNEVLKSRINDIKQIGDYILVATSGEGLVIIKNYDIIQINKSNGLNSNFVTKILIDNQNVCWLGTNKGLCKIVFNFEKNLNYKLIKYTKSNGLFAEEIKDMIKINNCIWLGTSSGLVSFFPENLKKNTTAPNILIDSILINNIKLNLENNYILPYSENSLSIFFKAISFKSTQKIRYKYKLEGFDDKWIESVNRYVRFPNLPSGDYVFQLTASSEDDNWNETPIIVKFRIKKHFTQTASFIIFVILFSLSIIVAIIGFIYNNLKKDVELKKLLIISEQKALRSQMNPHFIFNSLNSIRRYILENDNDAADSYLTSFASLMRLVLENSKQNFIELNTEIETLKRYLELEKMRFDNTFTFEIEVAKNINLLEVKIPPMLIQPYLENAIWHGLAPKKSNGILQLKFEQINNSELICWIEDNGIGRQKSLEISKKRLNHNSTGLKNIEERINLINKLTNSKILIEIIDLFDSQNQASGTKIKLVFPFLAFE